MKTEHIGIVVKDLHKSSELFRKLLHTEPYKTEEVESEKVITSFFRCGDTKIELVAPASADSAVTKFLEEKGEGIHHVAFEVDDIWLEMKRLEESGFRLVSKTPKIGADNKLVCFVHPKSANGVLVELCQEVR